ncbi:hypothetical protein [Polyangium aurulentum]|uniref:hypothetical protein n=1 Tax=Polyangium aurulentum TaxID=2567896 RepID=UPI00197DDAE2|nr:hypothetical protein [Polyangium aurulentum]UQA57287.1 hypothetical protein E8A73_039315 [Polyangium aurulentum]
MNRLISMMLGGTLLLGVALGASLAIAKPDAKPGAGPPAPSANASAAPVGPKSIQLPAIASELPPGPGRETAAVACVICHSPRYITGQPAFGRAVWVAEVDKMRKVYGAPIQEAQVAEIVDYLVAIRGTEAPPAP